MFSDLPKNSCESDFGRCSDFNSTHSIVWYKNIMFHKNKFSVSLNKFSKLSKCTAILPVLIPFLTP